MTGDPDDRLPELTPVQRRRLETSLQIHETPAERIAYQHTVLCQTCLPYRNPGSGVRLWERQQGIAALSSRRRGAQSANPRVCGARAALWIPSSADPCPPQQRSTETRIPAHRGREQPFSLHAQDPEPSPNGREIRRFKDQLARLAAAIVRMAIDLSRDRLSGGHEIIDAYGALA